MKIIYFSPHPHINMAAPSGPGTHIREVISGFEHRGHSVIKLIAGGVEMPNNTATIAFKKRTWKKLIPNIIWQSLKDYALVRLDKRLEKELLVLIEKEKPDFIYERAYYMMSAGYRVAKTYDLPYACEMNAPYPEEKSAMSGASLFLGRAKKNEVTQVTTSSRTFVVSSALKTYLEKNLGHASPKIIVTPNAVNPSNIHPDEAFQQTLRSEFGFDSKHKVIGFVGSIFPYHGVDNLIEAFAVIRRLQQHKIKLLIVGDGEILNTLKARTIELKIESDVIFTGNIPHAKVYNYIALMDCTVMARSNWYGSPVKIFEYGIMKKFIIAPDVVPVQDVMKHNEDGLLVADHLTSLQEALLYFLNHPKESESMANHFYNKVAENHTWQHVSDLVLEEMK